MKNAIDIATETIIESVKVSGKPIPSTIETLWEQFNLSSEELVALAKREISSMVRERLTGGTHKTKPELLPPTRSITVTSPAIESIHVKVRFVTDEIVYKAADGSRKSIMQCNADDFEYLRGRINGLIDGLRRHREVIDATAKTLADFGVATMAELPETKKLAVDQLWRTLKQLDSPALEASVA